MYDHFSTASTEKLEQLANGGIPVRDTPGAGEKETAAGKRSHEDPPIDQPVEEEAAVPGMRAEEPTVLEAAVPSTARTLRARSRPGGALTSIRMRPWELMMMVPGALVRPPWRVAIRVPALDQRPRPRMRMTTWWRRSRGAPRTVASTCTSDVGEMTTGSAMKRSPRSKRPDGWSEWQSSSWLK